LSAVPTCFYIVGYVLLWVLLLKKKLPNSGDFLKLIVPSSILKNICGWTNYSGKVISYKMMVTEMEYRGTKSICKQYNFGPLFFFCEAEGLISECVLRSMVKAQRVDGSWLNNCTNGFYCFPFFFTCTISRQTLKNYS